jgi:hypothetical protein
VEQVRMGLAAATPSPWMIGDDMSRRLVVDDRGQLIANAVRPDDAMLIVCARQWLPMLANTIERLMRENAALVEALGRGESP